MSLFRRLVWLLGALITVGAGYMVYQSGRTSTAMVRILETRTSVPSGTVITANMLGWAQMSRLALNPAAVQDPAQVIGRVLTAALPAGQQILPGWLTDPSAGLGSGFVSVPISTSPGSAASGTLQAGERVALMWVPGGMVNQQPMLEFQKDPMVVLSVQDSQGNVISGPGVNPNVAVGPPAIVDLRSTQSEATTIEGQESSGRMIIVGISQKGD